MGDRLEKLIKKTLIFTSCIVAIMLFFIAAFVYVYNLFPAEKGYEHDIYAVVLHNDTEQLIENINILYGDDSIEHNTVKMFKCIETLPVDAYCKVNIKTSDIGIDPPYNVYINLNNQRICTGYFGIGTGGFAVIDIKFAADGELNLEQKKDNSFMYKYAFWKHRREQKLLYW